MVFLPSGYTSRANYFSHLTDILAANQLQVTHRYMADSRPLPTDWQYLNVEQAAADHHRITELFKQIYKGKWISHGRSKNGMTALFHRRFYPQDVAATIASVAPIPRQIDDSRFDVFLAEVGSETCRQRIADYQKLLLSNRDQILPMIQNYINNSQFTYHVSPGIILEYEVCEYPFAFWQYGRWDCSSIPDNTASITDLYQHLQDAGGFPLYSQEYRDFYMPVFYQAYTELGWYRLINDHLNGLLVSDPNPSYSTFAPPNTDLTFRPEVMADIESWLQMQGHNIIYIYGGLDPWSAAAIELTGQTNALKIVVPDDDHDVRIETLPDPYIVYAKLAEWLDVEIHPHISNSYHDAEFDRVNVLNNRLFYNYSRTHSLRFK
jgi:hypothetical protein